MNYKLDDAVVGRLSNAAFQMVNPINILESFRPNQVKCKRWLAEEVATTKVSYDSVLVLGSWNGCLIWEMLNDVCKVNHFTFVDIDENTHHDREVYFKVNNLKKNYDSIVGDATKIDDHQSFDLIINTSAEHMTDIPAVYGPLYAVQSNNYRQVSEHINCVDSPRELAKKTKITRRFFEGSLDMGHYKRHMVVGYHL